ncbi:MAG: hypothetical protein Q7T63_03280, partial [Burkholderiaceae bacterium]|nr:hypothetical protein [Burkholderiaceae bacterium]
PSSGAAPGGALEMTQWLNHMALLDQLSESRAAVSSLVQQYATQVRQFEEQLRAGRAAGAETSGLTLEGLAKETRALSQYGAAFDRLTGGLDRLKQSFDVRLLEARLKNLTLADYAAAEQQAIGSGNARAKARLDTEARMMQSIEEDYRLAQRWGEQISGTEGVHQAMGLMNSQMNRVIQQNARVVQLLAQAQGSDKALKESEEASTQQQQRKLLGDLNAARRANQDAMLERVRSLSPDRLAR